MVLSTSSGLSWSAALSRTHLWSIGICLYEFMCGMVPFGEEAEDPYEIYEEIIKKDITYPNYLKDKKAKKLMDQLIFNHFFFTILNYILLQDFYQECLKFD